MHLLRSENCKANVKYGVSFSATAHHYRVIWFTNLCATIPIHIHPHFQPHVLAQLPSIDIDSLSQVLRSNWDSRRPLWIGQTILLVLWAHLGITLYHINYKCGFGFPYITKLDITICHSASCNFGHGSFITDLGSQNITVRNETGCAAMLAVWCRMHSRTSLISSLCVFVWSPTSAFILPIHLQTFLSSTLFHSLSGDLAYSHVGHIWFRIQSKASHVRCLCAIHR